MAGLLAAVLAAVTFYCLARALLPALRPADHGRDLDGWHAVMAGAMAVMLLAPWTRTLSVVALTVFVAGLGWALFHAVRRAARPAYLGLGVGCVAMAVMLLPATTAEAAPATGAASAMPGMHHSHAAASTTAVQVPSVLLLGVLLVALTAVLAVRLVESLSPALPLPTRLDACCDVAMAVAMVYMLGLMV